MIVSELLLKYMVNEPEAVEGYVAFETDSDTPVLKAPHEAETLAMSLLGAASEARAQQEREKANHERHLAVAAFLTALRDASGEPPRAGHTDPDDEHRNAADGKTWRLLWVETPTHGLMSWHMPAEYVPDWCEEQDHEHADSGDQNARLADLADAVAAVDDDTEPPSRVDTTSGLA